MTTDVLENPTAVNNEEWEDDPSNPAPAMEFSSELEEATLTISAYVDLSQGSVRPSFGAENDARILEQCQKYADKAGNYSYTLWFLEAEGISVVRSDGKPFRQSDILKLRSAKGDRLGANQAHALLAQRYADLGVNASFVNVGKEDSAVGRRFHFKGEKLSSGGKNAEKFAKPVTLVPLKIYGADEHFVGEVRVVTPRSAEGEDEGAPEGGGPVMPEAEAIAIVKEIFTGKTPGQLMNALLDEPRLQGVPTIFGVPLMEATVDESIVSVLQENRCMVIGPDGTLQAI